MQNNNSPAKKHGLSKQSRNHWAWLQARLETTALQEASQGLEEWINHQLNDLELRYASEITAESRRLSAGSLVKQSGR